MGRASPPPHLDKIQKNSSFFREPFPTFQHAVEKCHHIRSWRDSSWEPSSPPPHYEWASWWTRGRALSRDSRGNQRSPGTSLLRPSFQTKTALTRRNEWLSSYFLTAMEWKEQEGYKACYSWVFQKDQAFRRGGRLCSYFVSKSIRLPNRFSPEQR